MTGTLKDSRDCGNDIRARMRPPAALFLHSFLIRPLALATAVVLLCACGQSGDLYLPDKKAAPSAAPDATQEEEQRKKEASDASPPPPASTLPPSNTPTTP